MYKTKEYIDWNETGISLGWYWEPTQMGLGSCWDETGIPTKIPSGIPSQMFYRVKLDDCCKGLCKEIENIYSIA